MFSPCSELAIFIYWTCNLVNNLWSYLLVSCSKNKSFWQRLFTCITRAYFQTFQGSCFWLLWYCLDLSGFILNYFLSNSCTMQYINQPMHQYKIPILFSTTIIRYPLRFTFPLRPEGAENMSLGSQVSDLCFWKQNRKRNSKMSSKQSIPLLIFEFLWPIYMNNLDQF